MNDLNDAQLVAREVIVTYLQAAGIDFEETQPGSFAATLPGEHRLKTTTSLVVGSSTVSINAFVVRNPDENHEGVYRWLLERNRRLYGVSYAIDQLGDVYLVGRVPLHAVTEAEVDRVLGSVLENSDGAFDRLLELGFATAISREWQWRISRGESTRNLAAFAHLANPTAEA
ncbi:MAG: YbjN domain-containing protein [Candidatus Nanopelagicales bacterium]|nr:YbjN domain-containing protein [Candidatus Nanopelagicales bacterium]